MIRIVINKIINKTFTILLKDFVLSRRSVILLFKIYWNCIAKKYFKIRLNKASDNIRPKVFFGTDALKNYVYWKSALTAYGWEARGEKIGNNWIVNDYEFDSSREESVRNHLKKIPLIIKIYLEDFFYLDYVLKNFDVIVTSIDGVVLKNSNFGIDEAYYYRLFGIKTIIIPYGSDFWMYSKVNDNFFKHGLMSSCHMFSKWEDQISFRVRYWEKNADCFLPCSMLDGVSRWDCLVYSILAIDTEKWIRKKPYSNSDGKIEPVTIVHTPNHRYIKGTEFLIDAVKKLKDEGYKINFILLEKKSNEEVRKILCDEADILVEKLTYSAYGLSGVEGMACSLPVISNIELPQVTNLFRVYSFLNECPLVSASPENIYEKLKWLIENPEIRAKLGKDGRDYVLKYHSYNAFASFFEKVIDKICFNKNIDLTNLFHPLKTLN